MGLDIRIPLGLIFLVIGAALALFGAATHADAALYQRAMGVNLNLIWGSVMSVFGAIMFFVGRRQTPHQEATGQTTLKSGNGGSHH